MLTFFVANIATLCVGVTVLAVVALIIHSILREHKASKHSCSGNCAGCSACSSCHEEKK